MRQQSEPDRWEKILICHQMQFNSVLRFFLSRYYGGGEGRQGGGGSGGPRERWTFELGAVSTSQVTESFLCPLLIGFIGTDRTCLPHPLMWQTQLVCRSSRWSKFQSSLYIICWHNCKLSVNLDKFSMWRKIYSRLCFVLLIICWNLKVTAGLI